MANRVIDLLCTMFEKGQQWGWKGDNPASGITKFPEYERERFMDGDELRLFFESLSQELNETMRDIFLVAILTGQRRGNVQSMRWSEINLESATWTIPGEKAKKGKPISVALSPMAISVLESRKSDGEWVFPGRKSKSGHVEGVSNAWKRILKRSGLQDLRLHDLRWRFAVEMTLPWDL